LARSRLRVESANDAAISIDIKRAFRSPRNTSVKLEGDARNGLVDA